MNIAGCPIGVGHRPYMIAELGVNHDGSVERAMEMTVAAARAGASAIKLQCFRADLLMSRASRLAGYQEDAGETDPVEMLRRLELSMDAMAGVIALAHQHKIHAIVTVFSVELVAHAAQLPWDAYKTASPDIINKPLLDALCATGKPLIVSTGASTIDEVQRAIDWLAPAHDRLAVLQCVSAYPTPREHAAIGGMFDLQQIAPGPVGYSDHTTSIDDIPRLAVAAGATILEKHFTWSRSAVGPDHAASLEAEAFARYVTAANSAVTERSTPLPPELLYDPAIGPQRKFVLALERDVRAVSRQSLVARRALPQGHVLMRADLAVKRPGSGLPPFQLDAIIGRPLAQAVEADMPLTSRHLTPVEATVRGDRESHVAGR